MPPRSRKALALPYELWSLVAILALGSIFWLPRFEERLPAGLRDCPQGTPWGASAKALASPPLEGTAELPGVLGAAVLSVQPGRARIEREEQPLVRWLLCPLAFLVGTSLAALAALGGFTRRRRPKAAVLYLASMLLGAHLAWLSTRLAGYAQTITVSAGAIELETSEYWGLERRKQTVGGVASIQSVGAGSRYDLLSVPAKAAPKSCGWLLRARWVEPELLTALNQALSPGSAQAGASAPPRASSSVF